MRTHVMEEKNRLFGYSPRILESSIVSVRTTEKNPELKGVSTSPLLKDKNGRIIADLINDNFGQWLSGIFSTGGTHATRGISITASDATTKTINAIGWDTSGGPSGQPWNDTTGTSDGTRFQIGAGTTPVTRGDVNIETAFGVGAQASPFVPSGLGGFTKATGIVQSSGNVVTSTLGGVIAECALFGKWHHNATASSSALFMLAHDNISPTVTFLAGQTVNVEYSFQL